MGEWQESKASRVIWALFFMASTFRISGEFFGNVREQPWWGVALTSIAAIMVGLFAWTQYRIYTREPKP